MAEALQLYFSVLAVTLALITAAVLCVILWVAFNVVADEVRRRAGK